MPVYLLSKENNIFPEPFMGEPDGLLAIGGDLSVERLTEAYRHSIFPWYSEGDPILWWSPPERFIIKPEDIHISHSMKKFFKKHDVRFELNRDFSDTIHNCRMIHQPQGEWITDDMERAYIALYKAGFATGVEAFFDGELAGGLYGVNIGRCFFGESMFTVKENGSKAALILLAQYLNERDYIMIDCQFHTDHLESMGGIWGISIGKNDE